MAKKRALEETAEISLPEIEAELLMSYKQFCELYTARFSKYQLAFCSELEEVKKKPFGTAAEWIALLSGKNITL